MSIKETKNIPTMGDIELWYEEKSTSLLIPEHTKDWKAKHKSYLSSTDFNHLNAYYLVVNNLIETSVYKINNILRDYSLSEQIVFFKLGSYYRTQDITKDLINKKFVTANQKTFVQMFNAVKHKKEFTFFYGITYRLACSILKKEAYKTLFNQIQENSYNDKVDFEIKDDGAKDFTNFDAKSSTVDVNNTSLSHIIVKYANIRNFDKEIYTKQIKCIGRHQMFTDKLILPTNDISSNENNFLVNSYSFTSKARIQILTGNYQHNQP